jgi:hypothetical protein
VKKNNYTPQITARLEILPDDVEDVSHNRATVKLTPKELRQREEEKQDLARELEQKRANRDSVVGNVDDDIEHLDPRARRAGALRNEDQLEPAQPTTAPTSDELEAANAAVAEADEELAAADRALTAESRQQENENARRDAEHKARLDGLRTKRAAAEREAQRLRGEQERAALADRIESARRYNQQQKAAEKAGIDQRNEIHRRRVGPILEAVKHGVRELRGMLRDHERSLATLASMNHTDMPQSWNAETRIAFNRVVGDAQKLRQELHRAADGYTEKIPQLQNLLARGWTPAADHEATVSSMTRYLEAENVEGVLDDFRHQIARISSRLAEFDLTPTPAEPSRWSEREREQSSIKGRLSVPGQTLMPPASSFGGVAGQTRAEV